MVITEAGLCELLLELAPDKAVQIRRYIAGASGDAMVAPLRLATGAGSSGWEATLIPIALIRLSIGEAVTQQMWSAVEARVLQDLSAAPGPSAHSGVPSEPVAAACAAVVAHGAADDAVVPARMPLRRYRALDHDALAELCARKDTYIEGLRLDKKKLQAQLWKKRRNAQAAAEPGPAQKAAALRAGLEVQWKNPRAAEMLRPQFTKRGGLAAALRRNMGNCSAEAFGAMALVDISKQTIIRNEVELGACFTGAFVQFHSHMEGLAQRGPGDGCDFSFIAHAFRSDATTSQVHLGAKLLNTWLESCYVLRPSEVTAGDNTDAMLSFDAFLETQRVHAETAFGLAVLLNKQLHGAGCPLPMLNTNPARPAVTLWLYTSDGGPDQMKYRRFMTALLEGDPMAFWIGTGCVMHSYQLTVKYGLDAVDAWLELEGFRWRFFASMAKLVNVLREIAWALRTAMVAMFGVAIANELASRMIPKCISGRWGSIGTTMSWVLRGGRAHLGLAVQAVLTKELAARYTDAEGGDQGPAPVLDAVATDPRNESQQQHRERLGRWRREVLEIIKSDIWWNVVFVVHALQGPMDHLKNFIASTRDYKKEGSHLAALVWGKALQIQDEYGPLLRDGEWARKVADEAPLEWVERLRVLGIENGGAQLCGYWRRVA